MPRLSLYSVNALLCPDRRPQLQRLLPRGAHPPSADLNEQLNSWPAVFLHHLSAPSGPNPNSRNTAAIYVRSVDNGVAEKIPGNTCQILPSLPSDPESLGIGDKPAPNRQHGKSTHFHKIRIDAAPLPSQGVPHLHPPRREASHLHHNRVLREEPKTSHKKPARRKQTVRCHFILCRETSLVGR
jgi:hypothetical protein